MSKKILVVDDEDNMRHMLQVLLSGEGYEEDTAPDGEKALLALEKTKYDFVLCDIKMPGMGGLEACRRILQSDPAQKSSSSPFTPNKPFPSACWKSARADI
jgi:two-component system response regulator AtoC